MKPLFALAAVAVATAAAHAGTPALAPHDAGAFSVSLPKGWPVVDNPAQSMVVAQQDPKRKDAAQLLVIVSTSAQATADQLLDAVVNNGLVDAKVSKREPIGDTGKLLVADGKAEGIAARLGAIAVTSSGPHRPAARATPSWRPPTRAARSSSPSRRAPSRSST